MADDQRHGRIFGVLFIITFITSIAALGLFQPVLDDPVGYITGGGKDNQIYLGALAGVLPHRLRRRNGCCPLPDREAAERSPRNRLRRLRESWRASSSRAGSSSCSESSACGTTYPVRTTLPSRSPPSRTGRSSSAPEFFPLGNGLLLGYLMYRSGLVPRRMAWLGLIGGPLLFLASVGVLFDWWDAGSTVPALATIPEFIWELFLGVYCAIWGFRKDSPIVRPNWRGNATA